jgi:hypothetical protein
MNFFREFVKNEHLCGIFAFCNHSFLLFHRLSPSRGQARTHYKYRKENEKDPREHTLGSNR